MKLAITNNFTGKRRLVECTVEDPTPRVYLGEIYHVWTVTWSDSSGRHSLHGMPDPGKGRLSGRLEDFELVD